jgi:hypothetical protein
MRHLLTLLTIVSLLTVGCNDRQQSSPPRWPPGSSQPAQQRSKLHEATITRAEYGDAWPFTVDRGVLSGKPTGHKLSDGTELAEVTFTTGGKTYYINGIASGTHRYAELYDIWAADPSAPKGSALKKYIGPIIDRGLKLARGINEPFVALKPVAPPVAVASGPVKCDQFDILAAFEAGATGSSRRVRISIKTDLPDSTNLIVSIGRSFLNSANNEEYSIDYLEEKSTVADWRAGKVVELDQAKWQAELEEKRARFRKLGEKLNVTRLDSAVTASFVVHVDQSDKRFGLRNANLTGGAVEDSNGLRIVRRESKLEWPVTAQ